VVAKRNGKLTPMCRRQQFRSKLDPPAEGSKIRKYLLNLFSLQPEEARSASLMMLFFFLSMACVGVIKPLSTSLCIDKVGFDSPRYPALYACLALLAGPIVVLLQHMAKRVAHAVLLIATVGIFLFTFGIFRFSLFRFHETWVYFSFYAWGGLFTLLIPTIGWVISYDLYRIREAKRLFGLLATGGVLGGAAGSFSTALGAYSRSRLEIQVLVSLIILEAVAVLLYRLVRRREGQGEPARKYASSEESLHSLRDMLRLPYVRYMAGLVLLAAVATTLIDLNYQWFLKDRFGGAPKNLTQILALLLGSLYLLSACVNLFGQRILNRFSLPALLLISPVAMGGASLFAAVYNRFWPVVGVKAVAGILSPSLHRTGVEMLYVPLASRKSTLSLKSFIDLAVFKLGDALGALLFIILIKNMVRPSQITSALQIVAVSAWAFLALRIGKEYIRHLRTSVRDGMIVQPLAIPESGQQEEALLEALQGSDPVRIRLGLMGLRRLDSIEEDLSLPFPFEGENLIQTNMSAISRARGKWIALATSLLNHRNPEIGAAALHLLVRHDPFRQLRLLRAKLNSEWLPAPVYLFYLDRYIEQPGALLQPTNVLRWCQNLSGDERAGMARIMGKSRDRAYISILRQWTQQAPSPGTIASIEALGRFADPRFMHLLCAFLASYWSRKAARKALAFYGDGVVAYMARILQDPKSDPKISREIPLVLGGVRCSSSRTTLAGALYHPDPVLSYRALQALNRIRDTQELSYAAETFQPVVQFWARQYYSLVNLESVNQSSGPGEKLLCKALDERKKSIIERIFRTLDLFLPKGDAHYCYRVIIEKRLDLRDHAIELIDTQLDFRLKAILLPLLAESSCAELALAGRRLFNFSDTADAVFSEALMETDPWIRCCVLAAIREWRQVNRGIFESVQRCCGDDNALVRETARWAMESLQPMAGTHDWNRHVENN
jgi:AAA family ATP:ADP antiporter